MKHPFLVALQNGQAQQVLRSIPNLSLVQAGELGHEGKVCVYPHLHYTRADGSVMDIMLIRLADNIGPGNAYDLWMLYPDSLDWRCGCTAHRKLVRAKLASVPGIAGVWSLRQFRAAFPAVAEAIFKDPDSGDWRLPVGIWGDPLVPPNYEPSDADAANDVEPGEEPE